MLISQLASHPMCEISTIHQHISFNSNSRSRRSLGFRTVGDMLLHACAWTSPFYRGVYSIKAWTQPASLKKRGGRKSCIFSWKLGGRKIKGGRLNYLSTYLHRLPLIFSKNFSLATLARLHFIFTPNQGTRNIYSKDGKVCLTFKSGTKKRRFSVLHFWWPDVTILITQNLN